MKLKALSLFHRLFSFIWSNHQLFTLLTDDIGQFLKEQAFIDTCRLYEEYCSLYPLTSRIERELQNMKKLLRIG